MAREIAPCGTRSAYSRHLRRGETPCQPCRDANADFSRARNLARQRAWVRLARLYPDEYRALYAEELEKAGVR